ncbi:Do family serine endopeptidase [bacterium]|nr:Do family serine endopeptidase [bacterium]
MEKANSLFRIKKDFLKSIVLTVLFSTLLLVGSGVTPVIANSGTQFLTPGNFNQLAKHAGPAVVNIRTEKEVKGGGRVFRHFFINPNEKNNPFEDFFNQRNQQPDTFRQQSLGSGFIIDREGYIVTNNHVVENASSIKVRLKDGTEYDAKVVGLDPNTDLALIKIDSKSDLTAISFGNSDELEVGNWVVAIGSPFGLEQTVTAGIVSAKGRVIGSGPYDDFIQTDASINPGNSGGPLLNMKGEVVGINTAIINGGQGIGFAIPVTLAGKVIEQLKSKGEVSRGWLGIEIQELDKALADYYGLKEQSGILVSKVIADSPAEKAGIKSNDIIMEVNGQKTDSGRKIVTIISAINPGDTAEVKVMREHKIKQIAVKIALRDDTVLLSQNEAHDQYGIRVSKIAPEIAQQLRLKNSNKVMIADLKPGSKAHEAGMRVGDVIWEVNHAKITTVKDFTSIIEKTGKEKPAEIVVQRINRGLLIFSLS